MTDEARRLYYSPGHWKKMLDEQKKYLSLVTALYNQIDCSRVAEFRRAYSVLHSARARYKEFEYNYNVMSGHPCYMSARRHARSLIVGGINYGLMLEGLRTKLHDDIDNKFEREFRMMELRDEIIGSARRMVEYMTNPHRTNEHALDAMLYMLETTERIQRIGRVKRKGPPHYGVDFGKPGGDRTVLSIGNYEQALRTRSDEKDIPKS